MTSFLGTLLKVVFLNMNLNLTHVLENSSAIPTNSSKIFIVNTQPVDYNSVISICAFNAPFSLTAFLGNAAVLSAFHKTSSLHSPTNILLACLTASDLAVGLVAQPLFMLYHVAGCRLLKSILMLYQEFLVSYLIGYAVFPLLQ